MGIEELKLILETVEGVSDSAVWVVITYFAIGVFKLILKLSAFTVVVWLLYKIGYMAIASQAFTHEMLRTLGESPVTPSYSDKRAMVIEGLREVKDAYREATKKKRGY